MPLSFRQVDPAEIAAVQVRLKGTGEVKPMPQSVITMATWVAGSDGYGFVITFEERPVGVVRAEYAGYRASWVRSGIENQTPNRIDGGPWPSLQQAEAACRHTLKALLRRN